MERCIGIPTYILLNVHSNMDKKSDLLRGHVKVMKISALAILLTAQFCQQTCCFTYIGY